MIHDIAMRDATMVAEQPRETIRSGHADFTKISEAVKKCQISLKELDVVCWLAASHATSETDAAGLLTTDQKVRVIEERFVRNGQYPFLVAFARLLQFADFLDINPTRLNEGYEPSDFSPRQGEHFRRQLLFFTKIDPDKKEVRISHSCYQDEIAATERIRLCNQLIEDAHKHFNSIEQYLPSNWQLVTPPPEEDGDGNPSAYVPTERRIRVPISADCQLHRDERLRCYVWHTIGYLSGTSRDACALRDERRSTPTFCGRCRLAGLFEVLPLLFVDLSQLAFHLAMLVRGEHWGRSDLAAPYENCRTEQDC